MKSDCGVIGRSRDLVQVLYVFVYVVPYCGWFSDQVICLRWFVKLGSSLEDFVAKLREQKKNRKIVIRSYLRSI